MSGTIQINYEQSDEVAKQFEQQAEAGMQIVQQLRHSLQTLEESGWEGEGSEAYFAEMNDDILPALERLRTALEQGSVKIGEIARIFREAEEASSLGLRTNLIPSTADGVTMLNAGAGVGASVVHDVAVVGDGTVVAGWTGAGVPPGRHSAEHVRRWADFILKDPKQARKLIANDFKNPLGPELLRQLAGWASGDDADPRAVQAYRSALDMYKDVYDSAIGQQDMDLNSRELRQYGPMTYSDYFTRLVAGTEGHGAGQIKADLAQHILGRMKGVQDDPRAFFAREGFTKQLEHLALGNDADKMALNLALHSDSSRSLRPMLGAIMKYDAIGGEKVVGNLLGRVALNSAELAMVGSQDEANQTARLLGRVVANTEMAIHDTYQAPESGGPSAEHGAQIVNGALTAIDTLTGGASTSVTGPLRAGIDALADYEMSQVKTPAGPDPRDVVRGRLIEAAEAGYRYAVDPEQIRSDRPEVRDKILQFREQMAKGRLIALEQGGFVHQIPKTE